MESVDNIANPSSSRQTAVLSNKLSENIQHEKRVNFSAEKCELLKIKSIGNDGLLLNPTGSGFQKLAQTEGAESPS